MRPMKKKPSKVTAPAQQSPQVVHLTLHVPAKAPQVIDRKKTLILDAAESLFAEQGFAQVSIRDIAEAAKANIAAVNYHFGSKERLFEALFARRVIPVNSMRIELLEAAEKRGRHGKPALRDLIDAFVRPPLLLGDPERHGAQGLVMMRFLSRMLAMPKEHIFLEAYYGEVRNRFINRLTDILPGLPYETILWRYNLMVGALIYALAGPSGCSARQQASLPKLHCTGIWKTRSRKLPISAHQDFARQAAWSTNKMPDPHAIERPIFSITSPE